MNDKQERFCQEWFVDFNQTQAAIRAGYSPKTAYSQGERLMRNVEVKNRIAEIKKENIKKSELKREDIIKLLTAFATFDVTDFYKIAVSDDGEVEMSVKDLTKLSKEIRQSIQSIEPTKFGIKIRFVDKLDAIKQLREMVDFNSSDDEGGGVILLADVEESDESNMEATT